MSGRIQSGIPGARKAAILLAILGEDAATAVLRGLPKVDVERVAQELAQLGDVPPEIAEQVLSEFHDLTENGRDHPVGGREYTRRLLLKALGEDGAKPAIERVLGGDSATEWLKKAEPQLLAKLLEAEHPQAIALLLGSLDSKQSSAILLKMPPPLRAEVIKRLATLRHYSSEMAARVASIMTRRLQSSGDPTKQTVSGQKSVAEMMNKLDAETAREILELIETSEPNIAISIRDHMFTFEDFLEVSEPQIRELMGSVDKKLLTLALKGASDAIKNHFYRTMSTRAVEMLKEDAEAMGPVRSKEVMKAQQEIVAIARKLEAEGKLVLRSEGEDEYVV